MPVDVQPLSGTLVVELAWYLPIAHAGRELARLGARVVRVEAPEGDPLRHAAPAWDRALRGGKESVVCDLKVDAAFARSLCARADVVLEGLRPGVAARRGSASALTTCRHPLQYGDTQEALATALATAFAERPLADWLGRSDGEDVCVGPVATRVEAAAEFGGPLSENDVRLGQHTAAWRAELAG